ARRLRRDAGERAPPAPVRAPGTGEASAPAAAGQRPLLRTARRTPAARAGSPAAANVHAAPASSSAGGRRPAEMSVIARLSDGASRAAVPCAGGPSASETLTCSWLTGPPPSPAEGTAHAGTSRVLS